MTRWARIIAIVGLLMVALWPAGRGEAARARQVPSNILLIALGTDPSTFDPAQDSTFGTMEYYGAAYEGLTAYKGSTSAVGPSLARSWDISNDGRVYTFHLQSGASS